MNIALYILFGIGVLFNGLGALALMRFPDVYTRLHGATKCTTFGAIFSIAAIIVYGFASGGAAQQTLAIHAIVALIALLLTNPTGAHAIARAAHRSGVKPWGAVVDKLEEKP
ncbi:MAG: monovalent cation/H(+) antiporter subunit G [Candidatus Bipolaricaulota bacterium]|nr:MAG: monovalent cation/H(+) antiporter subunit G [Candidatus Bipolaricaulota bacterium]